MILIGIQFRDEIQLLNYLVKFPIDKLNLKNHEKVCNLGFFFLKDQNFIHYNWSYLFYKYLQVEKNCFGSKKINRNFHRLSNS